MNCTLQKGCLVPIIGFYGQLRGRMNDLTIVDTEGHSQTWQCFKSGNVNVISDRETALTPDKVIELRNWLKRASRVARETKPRVIINYVDPDFPGRCICRDCIKHFGIRAEGSDNLLDEDIEIVCQECNSRECQKANDHRLECKG